MRWLLHQPKPSKPPRLKEIHASDGPILIRTRQNPIKKAAQKPHEPIVGFLSGAEARLCGSPHTHKPVIGATLTAWQNQF
jgi:hypothetical protein